MPDQVGHDNKGKARGDSRDDKKEKKIQVFIKMSVFDS